LVCEKIFYAIFVDKSVSSWYIEIHKLLAQ